VDDLLGLSCALRAGSGEADVNGTPFGRYRFVELLGRGGMGEVWRAYDTVTDRVVAVKVLPVHLASDERFQQRFRREAKAAASLTNPHVVPIHDFGEINGRLFVDMRLIEGRDLDSMLAAGPIDPTRAVRIVEQIASALQAAHRIGLVHRDVKPSNILVAEDDFAYLIDFGIARVAGESGLTETGGAVGTWAYMAPERFGSGDADARSDVYALACVLYQSLTGRQPFPGDSFEQVATAHLMTPPPLPSTSSPRLSPALDRVIATGMAKQPDQRYATTRDLAAAARNAVTEPLGQKARRAPEPAPPTIAAPQGGDAMTIRHRPVTPPAAEPMPPTQVRPPAHVPQPPYVPQAVAPPPSTPPAPPPAPASGKGRNKLVLAAVAAVVVAVVAVTAIVLTGGGGDEKSAAPGSSSSAASEGSAPSSEASASAGSGAGIFSGAQPWNVDVSASAVSDRSEAIISTLTGLGGFGTDNALQTDFAIAVFFADSSSPKMKVVGTENYCDGAPDCDSLPAEIPVPADATVEGSTNLECDITGNTEGQGDCHLLVVDRDAGKLYEIYQANKVGDDITAQGFFEWDLTKEYPENLRGEQCTSADAGGFPISAMVVTADEVASGSIDHAIRFILPNDRMKAETYVHPASHAGGPQSTDPNAPPYGVRFRLKADFDESSFTDSQKVVLKAMKTYGMLLADGGQVPLTFADDRTSSAKWADLGIDAQSFNAITADQFEVVELGEEIPLTYDCVRND
jgi:serine/threonine protein kinase